MTYENIGAAPLLKMLGQLLRESAKMIQAQPGERSTEQVTVSSQVLNDLASRAEFLALQIAGKEQ